MVEETKIMKRLLMKMRTLMKAYPYHLIVIMKYLRKMEADLELRNTGKMMLEAMDLVMKTEVLVMFMIVINFSTS